jgi:hypothetical protein
VKPVVVNRQTDALSAAVGLLRSAFRDSSTTGLIWGNVGKFTLQLDAITMEAVGEILKAAFAD